MGDTKFKVMFSALKEVFEALSKDESPKEVLDKITGVMVERMGCFFSAIALLEEDQLRIKSYHLSYPHIQEVEQILGNLTDYPISITRECIYNELVSCGCSIVTTDINKSVFAHLPGVSKNNLELFAENFGLKSFMASPLMVNGRILGLLCVACKKDLRERQRILEEFSYMAAIAIEKSQRIEILQEVENFETRGAHLLKEIGPQDDVLATISHELKTPLTVALTSLELLKEDIDSDTKESIIKITRESLNRQDRAITELLKVISNGNSG